MISAFGVEHGDFAKSRDHKKGATLGGASGAGVGAALAVPSVKRNHKLLSQELAFYNRKVSPKRAVMAAGLTAGAFTAASAGAGAGVGGAVGMKRKS